MPITPDAAAEILAMSNVKVQPMPENELTRLAAIAVRAGVHLEIKASMPPDMMARIARVGGKNVTFDVS